MHEGIVYKQDNPRAPVLRSYLVDSTPDTVAWAVSAVESEILPDVL